MIYVQMWNEGDAETGDGVEFLIDPDGYAVASHKGVSFYVAYLMERLDVYFASYEYKGETINVSRHVSTTFSSTAA